MKVRWVVAMAATLMLGGCATVARGARLNRFNSILTTRRNDALNHFLRVRGGRCPMRDERIGSDTAYLNDGIRTPEVPGPACITPCTAQVARNQELIVTFTKEGYEPQTLKLSNHVAGGGVAGIAGNVIIGGAVGAVVDVGTGATMDHYPIREGSAGADQEAASTEARLEAPKSKLMEVE